MELAHFEDVHHALLFSSKKKQNKKKTKKKKTKNKQTN